jgi:hypothetical protein
VKPNVSTAAATVIAVVLARLVVTARPGRDGTAIARAATVAVRPDRVAARPGPKANAAGPSAVPDPIFAGASLANNVRHLRRCRKST